MVRFSRDTQRLLSFPTTPSPSLLSVSNPSTILLSLAFSLLRADWSFEQIPPLLSSPLLSSQPPISNLSVGEQHQTPIGRTLGDLGRGANRFM
ncbi:hypothetical protein MUK42_32609 [Musa troglodytarum]|uniref:Uncharacterized protein n=1 Tax=Musa troglodytarum TaxID=320322 RepID=A0A9E7JSD3_9LILI|nr:hypothetical protein MUK42_32609 [Musa troglodytarum]